MAVITYAACVEAFGSPPTFKAFEDLMPGYIYLAQSVIIRNTWVECDIYIHTPGNACGKGW